MGLTCRGDGVEVPPGAGIIPILKVVAHRQLRVIGTGFFVTRYGLFATARHVLDELFNPKTRTLGAGYVLQDVSAGPPQERPVNGYLRRIMGISFSNTADVALGQAANGVGGSLPGPPNLRGPLSFTRPEAGERLIGFAYPENKIFDLSNSSEPPRISGDYFTGTFLSQIDSCSRPFIPYAHYETTIEIRSGASGCPIYGASNRIVGIACRGWELDRQEHGDDGLSSIIPLTQLLPITVACALIPPESWEYSQIPALRRLDVLTFAELITYGHVDVGAV